MTTFQGKLLKKNSLRAALDTLSKAVMLVMVLATSFYCGFLIQQLGAKNEALATCVAALN